MTDKETKSRGRGRPTKFDPKFVVQAKKLAKLALTVPEMADIFDVSRNTFTRWMNENPEFRDAVKVGKEDADARVEQSLYHRAMGYSHDAVKIMVVDKEVVREEFTEHYPPDTTAMIFWLKNRKPKEWRDKQEMDLSVEATVDVQVSSDRERAKAMAALVARARGAGNDEGSS